MHKVELAVLAALAVCGLHAATTTTTKFVSTEAELVAALKEWNNGSGNYEITLAEHEYDLSTITKMHSYGLLGAVTTTGSRTLTLRGDPSVTRDKVVLDGKSTNLRILYLSDSKTTTRWNFENLTFQNGLSASSGAAIYVNAGEGITITNCVFQNCAAGASGGAVYVGKSQASNSTVLDSAFISNKTTGSDTGTGGGAIYGLSKGIVGCTFTGNSCTGAKQYGGALYCSKTATVKDCVFTDNALSSSSAYYAGAIYCTAGGTVTGCAFTNNTVASAKGGGAIYLEGSAATVEDCTFSGNSTKKTDGGAVYSNGTDRDKLIHCTFVGNKCTGAGGGAAGKFALVTNCTFIANSAVQGGGIANCANVIDCVFASNTSSVSDFNGGGAAFSCTLRDCVITNNSAAYCGGVYDCKVYDSYVSGNHAAANDTLQDSSNSYFENCEITTTDAEKGSKAKKFRDCGFYACTFHDCNMGGYLFGRHVYATNCLFVANHLARIRSSYAIGETDNLSDFINCTFVDNVYDNFATYGNTVAADKRGTIGNCFFYRNGRTEGEVGDDFGGDSYSGDAVDHSFFRTVHTVGGEGNLKNTGRDPRLMGALDPERPYAPQHRSCLNGRGEVQGWMASATDLDGHPRLTDGKVAIGAYETTEPAPGMMLYLR